MKPKGWSQIREVDRQALKRMFNYLESKRMNRYARKECREEIVAMTLENQEHGKNLKDLFPQGLETFSEECLATTPKEPIYCVVMQYVSVLLLSLFVALLMIHFTYTNSEQQISILEQSLQLDANMDFYILNGSLFIGIQEILKFVIYMLVCTFSFLLFARYNLEKRKLAFIVMMIMIISITIIPNLTFTDSNVMYECPLSILYIVLGLGGISLLGSYFVLVKRQWRKAKERT